MNKPMLAAIAATATLLGGGIAQALPTSAGIPTHEVPTWMRQTCKTDDSVNCYWPGGSVKPKQGESYRRMVPGKSKMVCVFFVNRPKRDYCTSTR